MMRTSSVLSLSPTFTSYSSSRLAEIAARVVEELRDQDEVDESFSSLCVNVDGDLGIEDFYDEFENEKEEKVEKVEDGGGNEQQDEEEEDKDEDKEFEFAFVTRDSVSSPTPADEIFYNGQIRPIYPVFDTSLLDGVDRVKENEGLRYDKSMQKPSQASETTRMPLRKLFIEEREHSSSCSSSEADELDGVAPETYCVWNPKGTDDRASGLEAKGHCKKSNSTGSSKRWRFRDLLHRSHSDGKERLVFLSHSNSNSHNNINNGKRREEKIEKFDKTAVPTAKVADKTMAAQQCAKNGTERRRETYLPYRQDLVGLFSNVHGASRNLHPF